MSKPNQNPTISQFFGEEYAIANATGCGRILLADDDETLRALVCEGLTGNGYHVDCVADGKAAWDQLCMEDYDLLITDHNMPELSGIELLRRLQLSPFDLPAILISGYMPASSYDFNQLLSHGAALAKPFSLEQLLMMIQAVLNPQARDENETGASMFLNSKER